MNSSESSIRDLRILMYHRIAPPGLDPWRLRVSPDHFEQQLSALKTRFEVINLTEIPHRQDFRNTVAITFDDGYFDNLLWAKPILEEFETPATVFITTSYVNADREFWWDELEHLFLYPGVLPESLMLTIDGLSFCSDIAEARNFSEEDAAAHVEWKVTYDGRKPPTARHQLFLNMWNLLVDLTNDTREGVLKYLFEWAEVERTVRKTHQALDSGRLRELSTGKHIQIGSHTVTHPDLTALPPEEKLEELNGSRRALEAMLGVQVNTISYPHGRYDPDTIELTRSAGYQLAFGAGRFKYPDLDQLLQLSRRMIVDCEIDEFLGAI